ncbi:MAG: hypothetical protein OEL55_05265, partial [Desulfobulbaceae bacterium]|nr:hypothetical protein [Desulfobulbaceae bacterium]
MSDDEKKTNSGSLKQDLLRAIPKVDEFLGWIEGSVEAPVTMVKSVVREVLAERRQAILDGNPVNLSDLARGGLEQ